MKVKMTKQKNRRVTDKTSTGRIRFWLYTDISFLNFLLSVLYTFTTQ
jgi:hypothetical protein